MTEEKVSINFDGQTLEGFRTGAYDRLALHIHGSYGNYYENPFVRHLTPIYLELGWSYASTNNPGHDELTVHENFDDTFESTKLWLENLTNSNSPLILQGHSLGALKIIALLSKSEFENLMNRVAGIVLLSPFDVVEFYGGQDIEARRAAAKAYADSNSQDAALPDSIFDFWKISAKTFLQLTQQNGPYDLFPTRNSELGILKDIQVPVLVAIGSQDIGDPLAVFELLQKDNINSVLIEGAPHNFAGCEDELADSIEMFLKTIS